MPKLTYHLPLQCVAMAACPYIGPVVVAMSALLVQSLALISPPADLQRVFKGIGPLYKREITTIFKHRMRLGRLRNTAYSKNEYVVSAWISFACLACLGDWHRTESCKNDGVVSNAVYIACIVTRLLHVMRQRHFRSHSYYI